VTKIWYACYGSNINFERFKYYIEGGIYPVTGKDHKGGCSDKTLPTENYPIFIPYELYFGNSSQWWDNSGVAFLDISKPSVIIGRAYLITDEQFKQIHKQEGTSSDWYDSVISLGIHKGYSIKTFTNNFRREENRPSDTYLKVIAEGMHEMIGPSIIIPNQQGRITNE